MPRRNRHKDFSTGKPAVFVRGSTVKPECGGCAFAGYGGVCTTSDGVCLITQPDRREVYAASQRRADTAS